jgi:hypothetical protein
METLKKTLKAYQFFSNDYFYAYSGETEEEAKKQLFEEFGEMDIDKVDEIPESKWDDKIINIYEDNDFSKKPFKESIRSVISNEPQLLFTNDDSNI